MRIDIDESELHKLPEGAVLVPGMPAERFFQTGERTIWAYLVGPVAERFSHSFR